MYIIGSWSVQRESCRRVVVIMPVYKLIFSYIRFGRNFRLESTVFILDINLSRATCKRQRNTVFVNFYDTILSVSLFFKYIFFTFRRVKCHILKVWTDILKILFKEIQYLNIILKENEKKSKKGERKHAVVRWSRQGLGAIRLWYDTSRNADRGALIITTYISLIVSCVSRKWGHSLLLLFCYVMWYDT